MREKPASTIRAPAPGGAFAGVIAAVAQWRRAHAAALRLAGCFAAVAGSVVLVSTYGSDGASGNFIWISNGLLLAYLLLAPRWRWPAYLATGFAGMVFGSALIHEAWQTNLFYNLLDMIEVLVGALLLRPRSTALPDFTQGRYLFRFMAFAAFAGPFVSGSLYALTQAVFKHSPPLPLLQGWLTAGSLGTSVACPIFTAIFRTHFRSAHQLRQKWPYLLILIVATLAIFSQTHGPLLFLIYPALILVLLRLGLAWAASSCLFVAFAGCWFTLQGRGPLAAAATYTLEQRCLVLQVFVATAVFMMYGISVVFESRRATERSLAKIAVLHALVTENSRDAILLEDFSGERTYVSDAIEQMTGWTVEEFSRVKTLDQFHADDRPRAQAVLEAVRAGAEGGMLECRFRNAAGDYIWVEANLRLVRDRATGTPRGFLYIVRDVTDRKHTEESRAFNHSLISAIHTASPDGILVVDNLDNVVTYNLKFAESWQLSLPELPASRNEKLTGEPSQQLLSDCVELVKSPAEFVARIREVNADPNMIDERQIELKDGRTLERYSAGLRGEQEQNLGRVWFFRDITERRLAQKKLQEAYEAVEALASTDPLTGLANRRRFDAVLNNEWRRSLRDHRPLSLLMIDADKFKAFNDTYGHPRGDSCLKQVAEAAQDVVSRPGDLVARFGGEEFAAILPDTSSEGALLLAREICDAMRGRKLPHIGNPFGIVTVSVGCATMVPAFGRHAVNLVEAADQALYMAKHRGRNQACDGSDNQPQAETELRLAAGQSA